MFYATAVFNIINNTNKWTCVILAEVSSKIHSRQKRIINPGGNQQPQPEPYQQPLQPPPINYNLVRLSVNGRTVGYGRLRRFNNIEANAHIVSHYGLHLRVSIRNPATRIRYDNLRVARYSLPVDFNPQNRNHNALAVLELRDIPAFLRLPPQRRQNHP